MEETIMQLILIAGDAKCDVMEALQEARKKNFERANELMDSANEKILKIHRYQSEMMAKECSGEKIEVSILMVHAQDHLTTALVSYDLASEFIAYMEETNR